MSVRDVWASSRLRLDSAQTHIMHMLALHEWYMGVPREYMVRSTLVRTLYTTVWSGPCTPLSGPDHVVLSLVRTM